MATTWAVRIVRGAEKELDSLDDSLRREAFSSIFGLLDDPVPPDAKALRGLPYYRIPFGYGQYRIVYRVNSEDRLIRVMRVRPRSTAYVGYPSGGS